MKPIILKVWMAMVFLSLSNFAYAYDFEDGGLCYTITSYSDLECEVSSYNGTQNVVSFPPKVSYKGKELKVTSIGDGAFKNNTDLNEIEFGPFVRKVGNEAFEGCSSLNKVILNDGIEELGKYSFSDCVSIESIELPVSILNIYEGTFNNCNSLSEINLPENVNTLHPMVFSGCSSLNSVSLLQIENIKDSSFEKCVNLGTVILGSNLTEIGNRAFKNCSSLCSIGIPHNLINIGEEAFAYTKLSNFYIPDNVTTIGNNTLLGCEEIRTVSVGAQISKIAGSSIWGCNQLDSLIIRNSNSILLLDGDKYELGDDDLPYYSSDPEYGAFEKLNVKYVEINRDIMFLSQYYFSFRNNYKGGRNYSSPFSHNIYIETLAIGGSFLLSGNSRTTKGGFEPFTSNTYARDWNFANCINLKNIIINNSNTSIPPNFFANCTNLISLSSSNISKIGKQSFSGCKNLRKISLPQIQLIEENAFLQCPIEDCRFSFPLSNLTNSICSCPLKLIEIDSQTPPQAEAFLDQTYIDCVLRVPYNSTSEYQKFSPWNNFWNIEELPEVKAEKIILLNESVSLLVNETSKLDVEIFPFNTSVKHLEWHSADPSIAIVDQDGNVKGISAGTTSISASCGDVTASCSVNVIETVGFKDVYSSVTYNDMSVSTNDLYFNYIPEIVGPFSEDDFWIELSFLDGDNRYPEHHAITINEGDYAGNYVNTNLDRPMWAGKYIFDLTSKGINPNVVANPSRAFLTVNTASNNLEWNVLSPISVKVGEKVDLGITYQANFCCTFNTDYNEEIISLSSDEETGNNPHWFATGLKEGETTLYFSIECGKNEMGFYDFSDSQTLSKRIVVEKSSGIENATNDENSTSIMTKGGSIHLINKKLDAVVRVYAINGKIIAETSENVIRNLPCGFYIVKVGPKSFKVAMR